MKQNYARWGTSAAAAAGYDRHIGYATIHTTTAKKNSLFLLHTIKAHTVQGSPSGWLGLAGNPGGGCQSQAEKREHGS